MAAILSPTPDELSPQRDPTSVLPAKRRLAFLDAVRGLAALIVLVQHICGWYVPGLDVWSASHFDLGQLGVVAFFLVSGFIIPVSIDRYGTVAGFWRGRFWRLYPMYWVSLLIATPLVLTGRMGVVTEFLRHPLLYAAVNVTMLQRFAGVPDLVGVYWTLALELAFYALASVLFARRWLRFPLWCGAAFCAAMMVFNNVLAYGLHHSPPAMHLGLLATAFVGTMTFRAHSGGARTPALLTLVAVTGVAILQGFYLHYVLLPPTSGPNMVAFRAMVSAWLAGYGLFFGLYALRHRAFPPVLTWLGRISYSAYLLHEAVLPQAVYLPGGEWTHCMAAIVATLGLSDLTYRWIERPLMRR